MVRASIMAISLLLVVCSGDTFANKQEMKRGILNKNVRQTRRPATRHKTLPSDYNARVIQYFGGTPVVTSPYLGLRSEFDGSDLIVNLPSINEDVRLLKHRYVLDGQYLRRLHKIPETPLIELSGQLSAQAGFQQPYSGSVRNDMDFTDAELDIFVHAHRWVMGFIAFAYDSSPNINLVNHRVSNARVTLDKSFITLGNLRNSPMYMTFGQSFVPFGRYKSHMITGSLTKNLGRSRQRNVVVGYKHPGMAGTFMNVFYFKGNANNHGRNNGGAHFGYEFSTAQWQGQWSASFLLNIADADRLQVTGQSDFAGFSAQSPGLAQHLQHAVPAIHTHVNVSSGPFDFLAEYVAALRAFSVLDLAYNHQGARPWAMNVEGSYHFTMDHKPASISFGYGHSEKTLAIQLPKHRFAMALNMAWWRDTIESLELRRDISFPAGATASGGGVTVNTTNLGKNATVLTAKIGLFF